MSAAGLPIFDKTLQTTNVWLDEIMAVLGPDRQVAWKALSVVLRTLRDRLTVELAAHLAAELPMLVRGAYYDQYKPTRQPTDLDLDHFVAEVSLGLQDIRPTNPRDAVKAVFRTLSRHIPTGQIDKVQHALPERLRDFWSVAGEDVVPPPETGARARERSTRV